MSLAAAAASSSSCGLPSQNDVQAMFDAASEAGVSPCMWIPPEWEVVMNRGGKLPDNSRDQDLFDDPEVIAKWNKHVDECTRKKPPEGPAAEPKDDTWPSPFGDFSHIDDEEFSARSLDLVTQKIDPGKDGETMASALKNVAGYFKDNRALIVDKLKGDVRMFWKAFRVLRAKAFAKPAVLKPKARAAELEPVALLVETPGQIHDDVFKIVDSHQDLFDGVLSALRGSGNGYDLLNRRDTVQKLGAIVGPDSSGMKRLAQVFDWVLCRTSLLMKDLNDALDNRNGDAYTKARINYINFVKDIDDHEPGKKAFANDDDDHEPGKTDDIDVDLNNPKGRSGYGGAMKWSCIDPVIYQGRIIGARAVLKWNPHSSSNGIPIPHNPS